MKVILTVGFAFFYIVILISNCDPGGKLFLKNGNKSRTIYLNGTNLNVSMNTISNTEFALDIHIITHKHIKIHADSMMFVIENRELKSDGIYFNGKNTEKRIFEIDSERKMISYGLSLDHKLKPGDEVKAFANRYVESDGDFFDIDTLTFMISRRY